MSYDARYRTQLQDAIFDLYRDELTDRIFLPKFFKVGRLFSCRRELCMSDSGRRQGNPFARKSLSLIVGRLRRVFQDLIQAGIRKDDPRLEQMLRQVKESGHLDEEVLFDHEHLLLDRESFKRFV